ncbi:related to beta transducin-like protein [Phialocephala subalpina]|uniref:Related to beta transducin-like protein n=1 Tax=Phialocephala subalpina TaxID=576137 RepID=A0A1L7XXJ6_9HELO|nr:related to beta transducin-like protein [Phialocephala subalpina]
MRLINVETFKLEEFFEGTVPPFAILSHTWGNDNEEVSFRNIEEGKIEKAGIRPIKLEGCCKQARKDGLRYAWIDTCCIDKANAVELGEAINSMFQWYRHASICYTYLADVPLDDNPRNPKSKFFSSRWFERGWTLQELLGPKKLHFYNSEWCYLGTKSEMSPMIEKITGIPRLFLLGTAELRDASVAQRMSWAAKRVTKRKEDIAYCLLGIFGVMMPMIYGEGDQAFSRLQQEIMRETTDDSILAWGLSITKSTPNSSTEVVSGESMNSFEIFGGSLRIHLPLLTTEAGETFGLLKCGSAHNAEQVIGIPLEITLSGGLSYDYIRPQGRYSVLLPKATPKVSTKDIHIRKERHSKALAAMNRRYWFYIEESVETNLELIDVEPRDRWQKDNAMIATAAKSDGNAIQRTTTRFRSRNEGSGDFIVVLEFEVRGSQMDVRCHVMISSRETPLENVAQNLLNMRQEAFGNQSASNGILHLCVTLRQEFVAGQPMFVVRLAAMPRSPEVTVDATWELQQLGLEPKLVRRLGEEAKICLEAKGLAQQTEEMITNSEPIKGQLEVVEEKPSRLGEGRRLLVDGLEKGSQEGSQEIDQLTFRGNKTEHQQDKLLLETGSDGIIANKNKWTPLSIAAGNGHIEVVKLLLDEGTSLNSTAGEIGPLQWASASGHIEVVKLLLERGADVNIVGINGWTPLHSASHRGRVEVVKLLLEKGADITTTNKNGWTPLSMASGNGHIAVVKLLLGKGALP